MSDRTPVLLVTRTLPEAVEDLLRVRFDPRLNGDDAPYEPDEIADFAFDADGIVVAATDRIDAGVIADLDDTVGLIATFSPGHGHIDLAAARGRGIAVTVTPGLSGQRLMDNLTAFFSGRTPPDRVA